MNTNKLLQLISSRCKEDSILEAVAELFTKHDIDWFSLDEGGEPLFICKSLSIAKGLEGDDFKKNYLPELTNELGLWKRQSGETSSDVYSGSVSLAKAGTSSCIKEVDDQGTIAYGDLGIFLIKGEYLQRAKQECPGSVNKRSPSILICHWERAAHYLAQGYSEAAKETVSLMADATRRQCEHEKASPELSGYYKEAQNLNKNHHFRPGSERWLQQQFLLIAAHTDLKYRAEYGLCYEGKQRFLDLLRKLPRKLQVIEFSLPAISREKVEEKLLNKEYPAALADRHGNRLQEYIFSSPMGATDEALSLIKKLDGQTFGDVKVKVRYEPFADLIENLIKNAFDTTPEDCHWRLTQDLYPLLEALPQQCTKQLLASSQMKYLA